MLFKLEQIYIIHSKMLSKLRQTRTQLSAAMNESNCLENKMPNYKNVFNLQNVERGCLYQTKEALSSRIVH